MFTSPDIFLQVVDAAGRPLAGSGNLGKRVLPLSDAARRGEVAEERVNGRPLFLTAAPLAGGERYIIVGRSPVTIYAALRELQRLLYAVVGGAVILAGGLGWLFAGAVLRPVGRVIAAAVAVKQGRDLTQRVACQGPRDEIGRLAATFNEMLAELEEAYRSLDQSNQRLRQFLADCSHELRTPLTLILSNLDLLARTGGDDPAFHAQALRDIRAEAARMARMVTQLLMLARADAGARVNPELVLLADLLADVARQGTFMQNGRIFDRFYRGGNAAGTTGTGLGLAIARWVADQHGGSIEVESGPGQGSRFTVWLPVL